VLIAEDRQEDIDILKLAFKRAHVDVKLRFVSDGEEAIRYFKGEGPFANRAEYPLPRLLLLDIKMPIKNGFEVLEWLRQQPGLRRLQVIIFSSSELPEDIDRACDLGANSYLVKPYKFDDLQLVARALDSYWLKLNRFPNCSYGPGCSPSTWETT
jgi:CheY-like chemotaxis protein